VPLKEVQYLRFATSTAQTESCRSAAPHKTDRQVSMTHSRHAYTKIVILLNPKVT